MPRELWPLSENLSLRERAIEFMKDISWYALRGAACFISSHPADAIDMSLRPTNYYIEDIEAYLADTARNDEF